MVFVKKLNDTIWFWADETEMVACYANMAELTLLFQKKFAASVSELLNFCAARDMWQSFRIAANNDVIVITEA